MSVWVAYLAAALLLACTFRAAAAEVEVEQQALCAPDCARLAEGEIRVLTENQANAASPLTALLVDEADAAGFRRDALASIEWRVRWSGAFDGGVEDPLLSLEGRGGSSSGESLHLQLDMDLGDAEREGELLYGLRIEVYDAGRVVWRGSARLVTASRDQSRIARRLAEALVRVVGLPE